MASPPVYGSSGAARRSRLLSPLAARARRRRHERFFATLGLPPAARILDVGCGSLGLRAMEPDRDITGVDLRPAPGYPGPFVQADVLAGLPFEDDAFDLVYCSSVIEHIDPADRTRFVAELRRVGRGLFLQTPAFSFPIEPHAVLPAAHWLPVVLRRPYWRLGVQGHWEDVRLLRRAELERLTGLPVVGEKVGPLTKSWIALGRPNVQDGAQVV